MLSGQHKENVQKRLNFFNKSMKKSSSREPEKLDSSCSSSSRQWSLDGKVNNNEVIYA